MIEVIHEQLVLVDQTSDSLGTGIAFKTICVFIHEEKITKKCAALEDWYLRKLFDVIFRAIFYCKRF
jgi:hypothetical protein